MALAISSRFRDPAFCDKAFLVFLGTLFSMLLLWIITHRIAEAQNVFFSFDTILVYIITTECSYAGIGVLALLSAYTLRRQKNSDEERVAFSRLARNLVSWGLVGILHLYLVGTISISLWLHSAWGTAVQETTQSLLKFFILGYLVLCIALVRVFHIPDARLHKMVLYGGFLMVVDACLVYIG